MPHDPLDELRVPYASAWCLHLALLQLGGNAAHRTTGLGGSERGLGDPARGAAQTALSASATRAGKRRNVTPITEVASGLEQAHTAPY